MERVEPLPTKNCDYCCKSNPRGPGHTHGMLPFENHIHTSHLFCRSCLGGSIIPTQEAADWVGITLDSGWTRWTSSSHLTWDRCRIFLPLPEGWWKRSQLHSSCCGPCAGLSSPPPTWCLIKCIPVWTEESDPARPYYSLVILFTPLLPWPPMSPFFKLHCVLSWNTTESSTLQPDYRQLRPVKQPPNTRNRANSSGSKFQLPWTEKRIDFKNPQKAERGEKLRHFFWKKTLCSPRAVTWSLLFTPTVSLDSRAFLPEIYIKNMWPAWKRLRSVLPFKLLLVSVCPGLWVSEAAS